MYLLCVRCVRQTFRNQIANHGCSLQDQAGDCFRDFSIAIECHDQAGNEAGNCHPQLAGSQFANDATISESAKEPPGSYIVQRNEYFENGKIASEIFFEILDNDSAAETRRLEYSYDEHGNLVDVTLFDDYYPSGVVSRALEYVHEGRLLKVYSYGVLCERYGYDEEGNLIYKYCYNSRGSLTDSEEYTYVNSLLFSALYMHSSFDSYEDFEGNLQENIQRNYCYEEYDNAGKLYKATFYDYNEEPYYNLYTYNERQTIIQAYSLAGTLGLCVTLDYDNQGRKIRQFAAYPDGELWSWHEYDHNDYSRRSITYSSDGVVAYSYLEEWDELNRPTFEASYDAKGELRASWEYIYDDNGYIASIINTDQSGNVCVEIAPQRDFYENGNVKTEVFYNDANYIAPIYRNRY